MLKPPFLPLNPDRSWVFFCGSKGSSSAEGSELYMIDPMQSTIATLAVWVAVWEFFQHCLIGIMTWLSMGVLSNQAGFIFSVTCAY